MVSVLIADDSAYMRDLLKRILVESGHEIVGEASNGDEAVEQYQKLKPEVLLLDIVMDEGKIAKNGIDALKRIVSDDPQARVIVCSALDEQNLIDLSMKAGAKAFVAKPFEPEKLLETLVTCTDLNIFTEIGNIGCGHAATVLSKLAREPVQVSLPKLQTGPPHLIARLCGSPDKVVTAVHMRLVTEPSCDCLIVFDPEEAKKIAAIMTNYNSAVSEEVVLSAVEEMGSIMICAFFSSIANFAELMIVPSKPDVVTDSFEAIIDVFLAKQLITASTALIFNMQFNRKDSSASGFLLMIPSPDFRNQLIEAGKKFVEPADVSLDTIASD